MNENRVQVAVCPVMMTPNMVFLPVVTRELRVAARRGSTYWTRAGAAAVTLGLGAYLLALFNNIGPLARARSLGFVLVMNLAGLAFFYACATGVRQSADAISQEKRQGTLGFLFLTDLRGYDVALGKLCGASLMSFYLLLAAFPMLMVAVMVGGVAPAAVVRCGLALVNMLFFANAVGLLVSVFNREARRATSWAMGFLVVYVGGFAIVAEALDRAGLFTTAAFLQALNPGQTYLMATSSRTVTAPFWWSLLGTQCVGWLLVGLASWRLPWCWQDKGVRENVGWRGKWQEWCCGSFDVRAAFRRRLAQKNPFFWLISRTRLGPMLVWMSLAGFVAVAFWKEEAWFGRDYEAMALISMAVFHTALKLWTAVEASSHLEAQRRDGSLETLLACTPMTPLDIVRGQWLALQRMFLRPVAAVLGMDVILIALAPVSTHWISRPGRADIAHFRGLLLAGGIILVADMVALGWVGMWQAMRQSRPRHAFGSAVMQILIWPWLLFGLLEILLSSGRDFAGAILGWLVISLVWDAFLASRARRLLLNQFRELASQPYASGKSWMAAMGGALGRVWARRARGQMLHAGTKR